MSKMPAKKKSCFQITSVTQAQVAASSIPDDTESLDDPDESRTEDVTSEIFDVSRADLGVCDRSSSEETLNNAGEPQEGHTGPVNGGLSYSKSAGTGRVTPHSAVPVSAAVPSPITTTSSTAPVTVANTSCNSRFRVIKLDHGTGEPFRRGRWTCTEFYERDSDSNSVNRTVDSIKPAVNLDHSTEKDSGLGATSISVITSSSFSIQILQGTPDSGYSASITHLVHPSESVHQGYSVSPQIGNGASAFQPTGYTATQKPQQAQVNMQPVAPQTFLSNSLNGVHHGAMHQMSPIIHPATQPQQFAYSSHPVGVSPGHPDYHQQHFSSNSQNPPMTSLAVGPAASQVPSPVNQPTTAGPGVKILGGEAASAQALLPHAGNSPAVAPVLPGGVQQQHVSQNQPSGGLGIPSSSSATTTSSHSGGQNVPATVPNATSSPPGVPNHIPGIGGLVQLHGAHGGATSNFSKQTDDSRPKPDALPQHSAGVVPVKDGVMPFFSESLSLPSPAVNSLFGIHITMDVDEDSASGASVVAIDNKIEQAMDLVKSHLMYAVREEVEVLKEQIKELYERNSMLERENAVLKSLANSEQINQLSSQLSRGSRSSPPPLPPPQQQSLLAITQLAHQEGAQSLPHQPNITSA